MRATDFKRVVPTIVCVVGALLAGCGGAQAPSGAPPAMPQIVSPATVSRWDLLYVSNGAGNVTVYRYWHYRLYHILTGFRSPKGLCVDTFGDVYVTDAGARKIFEYAHGGTKPFKVLADPGYTPYGCSIDPTTGNLAVANNTTAKGGYGGIAIYRHAVGKPELFATKYLPYPVGCGYDNRGNLFAFSLFHQSQYLYASFAYRPKKSASFIGVVLPYIGSGSGFELVSAIQWDGAYWAVGYLGNIFRFSIDSLGVATYQGETGLDGNPFTPGQFWITNFQGSPGQQGTQIVAVEQRYYSQGQNTVRYWNYPAGGSSIASISSYLNEPFGVTVSLGSDK